jgi:hypothetical protein
MVGLFLVNLKQDKKQNGFLCAALHVAPLNTLCQLLFNSSHEYAWGAYYCS